MQLSAGLLEEITELRDDGGEPVAGCAHGRVLRFAVRRNCHGGSDRQEQHADDERQLVLDGDVGDQAPAELHDRRGALASSILPAARSVGCMRTYRGRLLDYWHSL